MNRFFVLLLTACSTTLSLCSQTINNAKLDSLFNTLAKKDLALGGIAISRNGRIIYEHFMVNDSLPANDRTEYRLGSISKMFTAVIIFQLIEEKKLSLSDTLSRFFPDLPNAGKISIGHMLRHRSGLPNFTNNDKTHYDDWKERPKTHEELLAMIRGQKPDFEPDAKADYNNSNYLLLGYIIEKISNKDYRTVVNDRIIRRIGLNKTYYAHSASLSANECASYKYADEQWIKDKSVALDNFGGAGAMISTPADMTRFIQALFDYRLVRKESLEQMKTMVDGYGMGMFPYGSDEHPGFGHNGKTEGFASSLSYYPKDRLAIAYCTNGEVYPKSEILDGVRAICFNQPYTIPGFSHVSLSDQELDQYTGSYSGSGIQIKATRSEGHLEMETRGKTLRLEAIAKDQFMNTRFGFFFDFHDEGKALSIRDVDNVYELKKE